MNYTLRMRYTWPRMNMSVHLVSWASIPFSRQRTEYIARSLQKKKSTRMRSRVICPPCEATSRLGSCSN